MATELSEKMVMDDCKNVPIKRCKFVNLNNPLYIHYHDHEWSKVLHDENKLIELFILETFHCGLSFECVLNKRADFIVAFDNFDINKIAQYDDEKVASLLYNSKIIRHKQKILATINNAKVILNIQQEFGSFDKYIWHFTNFTTIVEPYTIRTSSALSDEVTKDLKSRGMKFVGTVTIYSFLQACGVIFAHENECVIKI